MHRRGDYYAILEVAPDAEPDIIRAAYRILAKRYHPDHPAGSQARMAELNGAWELLRDPERRALYDRERLRTVREPSFEPVFQVVVTPDPQGAGPLARRRMAAEPTSQYLDFGRYAGSSLEQVAQRDPDYLEWLARVPAGRGVAREVGRLLARRRRPAPVPSTVR